MLLPPEAQPDSPTSPGSVGSRAFDLTKLVEPTFFEQSKGAPPLGNAPATPEAPSSPELRSDSELLRAFLELKAPDSTPTA